VFQFTVSGATTVTCQLDGGVHERGELLGPRRTAVARDARADRE
jgi:hypothetical protein